MEEYYTEIKTDIIAIAQNTKKKLVFIRDVRNINDTISVMSTKWLFQEMVKN